MPKQRILFCGEWSQLSTGYSTYYHELLTRIHATGKYEIAELACYISPNDPRLMGSGVPWRVYPVLPNQNSESERQRFVSKVTNQFGEWKFEEVLLDFKPDTVCDIRDWWMFEFQERSPFRRFYNWLIMPTVDAAPQQEQWIATFMNADAVLTYSDWGRDVLKQEGGGLIKLRDSAPPCADLNVFHPIEKKVARNYFGMTEDAFVVGTVMRNQGRKLYPDLMDAFVRLLKKLPHAQAVKTYLYLHTSFPDQGFDIPCLIKRSGLGHKILMTYKCQTCAAVFPSFFADARTICPKCKEHQARIPNVQSGIDRSTLGRIINLFDVYVQYANSEGFGMPQVEAAACGIPVFATDYSAMSDVVRKLDGYPIKVDKLQMDVEFGCYRAIPSNEDLAEKLFKYINLDESVRLRKRKETRERVERHYRWENTAKRWENVLDNLPQKASWDSPPHIHTPKQPHNQFSNREEFVQWCITNVFGRPEFVDSYMAMRLIRDLNYGMVSRKTPGTSYHNDWSATRSSNNMQDFNEQNVIKELTDLCNHWNMWEIRRTNPPRSLIKPQR